MTKKKNIFDEVFTDIELSDEAKLKRTKNDTHNSEILNRRNITMTQLFDEHFEDKIPKTTNNKLFNEKNLLKKVDSAGERKNIYVDKEALFLEKKIESWFLQRGYKFNRSDVYKKGLEILLKEMENYNDGN